MRIVARFASFVLLAAFVLAGVAADPALAAWETILEEDYVGPEAVSGWNRGTEADGAAIVTAATCLLIRSGTTPGASAWIESIDGWELTTGWTWAVAIDAATATDLRGDDDDALWGFFRDEPGPDDSYVAFRVIAAPDGGDRLWAEIRSASGVQRSVVSAGGWDTITRYRIEVTGFTARFFVEGALVAQFAGPQVPAGELAVRLQKTSPGIDRLLVVDRVLVEREMTPVAVESATWAGVKALYR